MRNGDQNQTIEDGRRYRFNENDLPTLAVIEAVARETGVDPTALRPLYEVVDPDALDALLCDQSRDGEVRVTFTYAGRSVAVDGDWVTVGDD